MTRRTRSPLGSCLLSAALVIAATPAAALQIPRPGVSDARVRLVDYDPLQVVRITGVYRTATQILVGDDETILHVALGDATAWDVAAEKSIIFIKPKAAHGLTNLIVTTTKPGGELRNYTFELKVAGRDAPASVYVLRFRYPNDLKAAVNTAIATKEAAIVARLTQLKLDHGAVEGARNFRYEVQGAEALQPAEVSDNGRFTILRFAPEQAIPAIYQLAPDGSESIASFDVRGEFVVVHGTAKQFRLRRGHDVLCIYNEALDPIGTDLGTQTASSDVSRTDNGTPAPQSSGGQP